MGENGKVHRIWWVNLKENLDVDGRITLIMILLK
jgi:hypothetical protein